MSRKSISLSPERYSAATRARAGGIVHATGADCDEEFLRILAMIQTLSQARDAYELFELAARYTSDGPIAGEAHSIVVVSTEGIKTGEYMITRKLLSVPRRRQSIEVADSMEAPVAHQGGFISSILRKRQPELITGLDLSRDPVLGAEFATFDSCLFIPLFSGGRMTKCVLFFRRGWDEVDFDHVERVMLIMNLIETAIESINNAHRSSELSSLLDAQFEQMSRIQRRLLPRESEERRGLWESDGSTSQRLEVGMSYRPAGRAGGDYFNIVEDGERLGVLVADVSGHGADAAMIMGMLHAVMHGGVPVAEGPGKVLSFLNARLKPMMADSRFITAFFAVIDPVAGVIRYSCAGHPPPRLRKADGTITQLDDGADAPIGVLDDLQYCCAERPIASGDAVVLYTDGITETFSPTDDAFGSGHLDLCIETLRGSAADMALAIAGAANDFRQAPEPEDDTTVVVVSIK
ncbi:MAG: PP2C family protein-serine/threonine phosphatase [Phycisphaerales bacterium]